MIIKVAILLLIIMNYYCNVSNCHENVTMLKIFSVLKILAYIFFVFFNANVK